MFKKKGIALKTFIFTSVLITFVVLISFGILYAVLPNYYFDTKNKTLNANAELLVKKIAEAGAEDEVSLLIRDFSQDNNAEVMSYDADDELIITLSSPFNVFFVGIENAQEFTVKVEIKTASEAVEPEDGKKGTLMLKKTNLYGTAEIPEESMATYIRRQQMPTVMIRIDIQNRFVDHVEIISTLQPIDEAQRVILSLTPYLLAVDVLIALVAAYFFARRFTRPILHLSETAAGMQTLSPDICSGIRTDDELGELSQNLDSLYSHLCENIESLRVEMTKVSVLERSKTDFMRAASHELKTPVAALNGLVEGMIDQVGRYRDRDTYLHECKKLIDSLTGLIREILNASRLEPSESIIQAEPVQLWELVEATLENNRLFIDEKKLEVSFEKKDLVVTTDQDILRNALSNVISNAVKYTEDGKQIHIALIEEDGRAVLSVENQCETIPEDDLAKLFEPFYTRSYSRNRSKSGTGLGLYIVRRSLGMLTLPYELANTNQGLRFRIFFEKP